MAHAPLVSLEARELAAAGRLAYDADVQRVRLSELVPGDGPNPCDHRGFAADAAAMEALDPPRATLLAEAFVVGSVAPTQRAYLQARAGVVLRLRPEAPGRAFDTHEAAVMVDPETTRRAAWVVVADAALAGLRRPATAAVEALREALAPLDVSLQARLGFGGFDPRPVLAATDDLLHELDPYIARTRGLDLGRGQWSERLASLAGLTILRALPPATWAELGTGWAARVGLDEALRAVGNGLRPARAEATGVAAVVREAGGRCDLLGRPSQSGMGAQDTLGACGVALGAVLGRGLSPGQRRGLDRASDGLWHALVRRLTLDAGWLTREAEVDAVTRQKVMLEALHAEVLRVRRDAVMATFVADTVARADNLGTRFREGMTAAWGAAPEPGWAVHVAARAMEPAGWWGDRPAARVRGALAEATALGWLRMRFNEDWWRNPRAGDGVRSLGVAWNALGVDGWMAAEGADDAVGALRARFEEVARVALR